MSTAIIVITDKKNGQVGVNLNFGDGGVNEKSSAHSLAVKTLGFLVEGAKNDGGQVKSGQGRTLKKQGQ